MGANKIGQEHWNGISNRFETYKNGEKKFALTIERFGKIEVKPNTAAGKFRALSCGLFSIRKNVGSEKVTITLENGFQINFKLSALTRAERTKTLKNAVNALAIGQKFSKDVKDASLDNAQKLIRAHDSLAKLLPNNSQLLENIKSQISTGINLLVKKFNLPIEDKMTGTSEEVKNFRQLHNTLAKSSLKDAYCEMINTLNEILSRTSTNQKFATEKENATQVSSNSTNDFATPKTSLPERINQESSQEKDDDASEDNSITSNSFTLPWDKPSSKDDDDDSEDNSITSNSFTLPWDKLPSKEDDDDDDDSEDNSIQVHSSFNHFSDEELGVDRAPEILNTDDILEICRQFQEDIDSANEDDVDRLVETFKNLAKSPEENLPLIKTILSTFEQFKNKVQEQLMSDPENVSSGNLGIIQDGLERAIDNIPNVQLCDEMNNILQSANTLIEKANLIGEILILIEDAQMGTMQGVCEELMDKLGENFNKTSPLYKKAQLAFSKNVERICEKLQSNTSEVTEQQIDLLSKIYTCAENLFPDISERKKTKNQLQDSIKIACTKLQNNLDTVPPEIAQKLTVLNQSLSARGTADALNETTATALQTICAKFRECGGKISSEDCKQIMEPLSKVSLPKDHPQVQELKSVLESAFQSSCSELQKHNNISEDNLTQLTTLYKTLHSFITHVYGGLEDAGKTIWNDFGKHLESAISSTVDKISEKLQSGVQNLTTAEVQQLASIYFTLKNLSHANPACSENIDKTISIAFEAMCKNFPKDIREVPAEDMQTMGEIFESFHRDPTLSQPISSAISALGISSRLKRILQTARLPSKNGFSPKDMNILATAYKSLSECLPVDHPTFKDIQSTSTKIIGIVCNGIRKELRSVPTTPSEEGPQINMWDYLKEENPEIYYTVTHDFKGETSELDSNDDEAVAVNDNDDDLTQSNDQKFHRKNISTHDVQNLSAIYNEFQAFLPKNSSVAQALQMTFAQTIEQTLENIAHYPYSGFEKDAHSIVALYKSLPDNDPLSKETYNKMLNVVENMHTQISSNLENLEWNDVRETIEACKAFSTILPNNARITEIKATLQANIDTLLSKMPTLVLLSGVTNSLTENNGLRTGIEEILNSIESS